MSDVTKYEIICISVVIIYIVYLLLSLNVFGKKD